jgi:diaminopimelate epimerase
LAPNPHAVVHIDAELPSDPLAMPTVEPADAFPGGVNVEFAIPTELGASVRVVERGVGETLSCGTGACAVAATLERGDLDEVQIDLPGGSVWVSIDEQGHSLLRGPADLIARGTVLLP